MILDNAYNAMQLIMGFPYRPLVRPDGNIVTPNTVYNDSNSAYMFLATQSYIATSDVMTTNWGVQSYGLVLGTGITAVQKSDYCLSGTQVYSGFTETHSCSYGLTDGDISTTYVITATDDISIGEIGYYSFVIYERSKSQRILMSREVLPSVLTLASGDSATIIYTISATATSVEVI